MLLNESSSSSAYLLSIITITHDEARNMPAFLEGIDFLAHELKMILPSHNAPALECIIVDSGSQDATQALVQAFAQNNSNITLKWVPQHDWQGFGYQKNYALIHATGAWVLSLDADEFLNQKLAAEIAQIVTQTSLNDAAILYAYKIKRLNYFLGKAVKYSGWQRDIVLRLWQRHPSIRFSDDVVHERVVFENTPSAEQKIKYIEKICQHSLSHHPYQNKQDVLRKVKKYSDLGAQKLKSKGKTGGLIKAIFHGGWAFFKTFCLHLGVLDGRIGFQIARMNAQASYFKYVKAKSSLV